MKRLSIKANLALIWVLIAATTVAVILSLNAWDSWALTGIIALPIFVATIYVVHVFLKQCEDRP